MNWLELTHLLPVGVVLCAALIVVFLGLVLAPKDRYVLSMFALAGCVLGLGALGQSYLAGSPHWFAGTEAAVGKEPLILKGAFAMDGFGMVISVVALLAGALSILYAPHEDKDSPLATGEYYGLILLAVAGMMLLGHAHDFLTLLISLEIMSIATYILAGSERRKGKSTESALKYVVLGAFSSAFLMMGIAFIFGATGSLSLDALKAPLEMGELGALAKGGMALMLVGLLFKVGAVPFHAWIPDVYEGAPTGVTGLMAVGVKAAAFAVLARLCFETFGHLGFRENWTTLLMAVAVITMALGNLLAMHQDNVKRMLAYSGIAHTGYLLLAFLLLPTSGAQTMGLHLQSVVFYLLAYAVMTLGAFGVVSLIREDGRPLETMDDFAGLAREHPALALCMATFMFSLAGLPPFAGFFAKFMVFRGAIEEGFVVPAVLGILTSVASLYYYLRVVVRMYMAPEVDPDAVGTLPDARCKYSWTANVLIYGAGLATLLFGLFPHWLPGW